MIERGTGMEMLDVSFVETGEQLRHECGVFAIAGNPDIPVGFETAQGLSLLQRRGQDAAGMAVFTADEMVLVKEPGLVPEVFPEAFEQGYSDLDIKLPDAHTAIGHVRWSTSGDKQWTQPFEGQRHRFAIAHNGEIPNIHKVAIEYGLEVKPDASDSYVISVLLDEELARNDSDLPAAMYALSAKLEGGYGIVASDGRFTVGMRDPWGNKPLSYAERAEGGFVIASETVAFAGTKGSKDVPPGHMVVTDGKKLAVLPLARKENHAECVFERIYFADEKSRMDGRTVRRTRERLGEELAREEREIEEIAEVPEKLRFKPDFVLGVPKSGKPSAKGYAKGMDATYIDALVKKTHLRTFILPDQLQRETVAETILELNEEYLDQLKDAVVAVVDDSLVHGTMAKAVIKLLRKAGVREVHFRITSPQTKFSCHLGANIRHSRTNLAARAGDVRSVAANVEADSLGHLSKQGMARAIGKPMGSLCMGCIDGINPVDVPEEDEPHTVHQASILRPLVQLAS